MATPKQALEKVRKLCMGYPEASERLSHGSPTFFVREKKSFTMFLNDHHGDGRLALWIPAGPGVQSELVQFAPQRFFVPPYVGHRGWLGVRLDGRVIWDEVAELIDAAYCLVAPRSLVALLDSK